MYPEGLYQVEVTHQEMGASSTGTPQLAITFKILSRVAGEPDDDFPVEKKLYLYFTPKTKDFVERDLRIIGFAGKPSKLHQDCHDQISLIGKKFPALCKYETYNDKERERWSVSSKKPVAPLDEKALDELDEMFADVEEEESCF